MAAPAVRSFRTTQLRSYRPFGPIFGRRISWHIDAAIHL